MTEQEFEDAVEQAYGRLPEWVRQALHNIDILVLDRPEPHMDPEGTGLLGLYLGTPLPERGTDYAGALPDIIYIFRLPHLELDLPEEELRLEITRTLWHEIAHYFGIDDAHLDEIGWG